MRIFRKAGLTDLDELEYASAVLARLVAMTNPEVDEFESFGIIFDLLKDGELGLDNVDVLAKMVRTTIFDPLLDTTH